MGLQIGYMTHEDRPIHVIFLRSVSNMPMPVMANKLALSMCIHPN